MRSVTVDMFANYLMEYEVEAIMEPTSDPTTYAVVHGKLLRTGDQKPEVRALLTAQREQFSEEHFYELVNIGINAALEALEEMYMYVQTEPVAQNLLGGEPVSGGEVVSAAEMEKPHINQIVYLIDKAASIHTCINAIAITQLKPEFTEHERYIRILLHQLSVIGRKIFQVFEQDYLESSKVVSPWILRISELEDSWWLKPQRTMSLIS